MGSGEGRFMVVARVKGLYVGPILGETVGNFVEGAIVGLNVDGD